MKESTAQIIEGILKADETVSPEARDFILRVGSQRIPRRKLINAKQAQEILDVSRVTLREYVRKGILTQINISSRKVRFDEEEVSRLAYNGLGSIK